MVRYSKKRISGIIAIVFGILVVIIPKFLAYVVGIYLIISGVLSLIEE